MIIEPKQKNIKYREVSAAFLENMDYYAKIENGTLRVELTKLPDNICVGYELLRNMRVVDFLSPSYVVMATFVLKSFGDYSVRVRFYQTDNLNVTISRFDTIHFIYTLSMIAKTLNPERNDIKDAIDRLERFLFDEKRHKEHMGWLLSALSHQVCMGYTFVDYLLSVNVTSLYFYCNERDWELGRALFLLLYNDQRIKIENCISEMSFEGEGIENLHPKIRFLHKDASDYKNGENVLVVSVFPQPNLEYELKNLGLNIFKMDDITKSSLNKGLFVSPYNELKQRNPNVDIVVIKRPLSIKLVKEDKRTDNENEIVAKKVNIKMMRTWLKQNPPAISLALSDCGVAFEDAEEFVAYTFGSASDLSGYARPIDRQGRLVNVNDGYRVTTDQPQEFDNTIYFYGDFLVYSPFTSDDKTAPSFLQRLLNSNCDRRYRVINCGGWRRLTFSNMINNMLKVHEYKDGDMIIMMLDFIPDPTEVDYTLINLEKLFARPHKHGEIWIDVHPNVNETGQKIIAEGLYNGLEENGLI